MCCCVDRVLPYRFAFAFAFAFAFTFAFTFAFAFAFASFCQERAERSEK